MMYNILVTIKNSQTKVRGWGYLINSDSAEEAKEKALEYAKNKANKPYSRYEKCIFEIKDEDVIEKPDW